MRWWTRLTFYGNDKRYEYNQDVCQIVAEVDNNITDLESYGITKENYDLQKQKTLDYYDQPLTKREFPELTRDERMKKHIEYLKEHGDF